MKLTPKKQTGFTLIEIVIVLAIAALIMVIVFLAISGAQRARRDTAMKDAAAKLLAANEQYAGNNNGNYTTAALGTGYLNNVVGNTGATLTYGTGPATSTVMYYASGNICDTSAGNAGKMTTSGANARNVAVSYWSESANGPACIDNK